mgnify:CR=1 FL=1
MSWNNIVNNGRKTVKNIYSILDDDEFTYFSYKRKNELTRHAKEIYNFCDKFTIYEKKHQQKRYYTIIDSYMKKILMLRDDRGLIEEVPRIVHKQLFSLIHDIFRLRRPYDIVCLKDRFYVLPSIDADERKDMLEKAEEYPNLFLSDKWFDITVWGMKFPNQPVYYAENNTQVIGVIVPYSTYPGVILNVINFFYEEL